MRAIVERQQKMQTELGLVKAQVRSLEDIAALREEGLRRDALKTAKAQLPTLPAGVGVSSSTNPDTTVAAQAISRNQEIIRQFESRDAQTMRRDEEITRQIQGRNAHDSTHNKKNRHLYASFRSSNQDLVIEQAALRNGLQHLCTRQDQSESASRAVREAEA